MLSGAKSLLFLCKEKFAHQLFSSPEPKATRWAYSIPVVSCLASIVRLEYLWGKLANLDKILCEASLGWGMAA